MIKKGKAKFVGKAEKGFTVNSVYDYRIESDSYTVKDNDNIEQAFDNPSFKAKFDLIVTTRKPRTPSALKVDKLEHYRGSAFITLQTSLGTQRAISLIIEIEKSYELRLKTELNSVYGRKEENNG